MWIGSVFIHRLAKFMSDRLRGGQREALLLLCLLLVFWSCKSRRCIY